MKLIHFFTGLFFLEVYSREAAINENTALQISAVVSNLLNHGYQILIYKNFCMLRKIVFVATLPCFFC